MWNDGTPVTANDWVATFQYGADPKHAWDFTWYFNGVIKNWEKAVAGEVPVADIGVTAVDDHTLQFETQTPTPYLPAMLIYSTTLSKKALETSGPLYNSNVETTVSSGPYKLVEWTKNQRVVYEINPDYKGTNVPYIQKVIVPGYGPGTQLAAYQNNEIDYMPGKTVTPADLQIIQSDPDLKAQYHPHYGDFRTDYIFFDSQQPPFNDLRVRQAFAHAYDREDIVSNIVGVAGYSGLFVPDAWVPRFQCRSLQGHLSLRYRQGEAIVGRRRFPERRRLPQSDAEPAHPSAIQPAVGQAYASTLKKELGIDIEVASVEQKTFMDGAARQAHQDSDGHDLLRHGFPGCEQHVGRVPLRWPPQLEQRGVRQAGEGSFAHDRRPCRAYQDVPGCREDPG